MPSKTTKKKNNAKSRLESSVRKAPTGPKVGEQRQKQDPMAALGQLMEMLNTGKNEQINTALQARSGITQSPRNLNAGRSAGLAGWYELNPQARQGESYAQEQARTKEERQHTVNLERADRASELAAAQPPVAGSAPQIAGQGGGFMDLLSGIFGGKPQQAAAPPRAIPVVKGSANDPSGVLNQATGVTSHPNAQPTEPTVPLGSAGGKPLGAFDQMYADLQAQQGQPIDIWKDVSSMNDAFKSGREQIVNNNSSNGRPFDMRAGLPPAQSNVPLVDIPAWSPLNSAFVDQGSSTPNQVTTNPRVSNAPMMDIPEWSPNLPPVTNNYGQTRPTDTATQVPGPAGSQINNLFSQFPVQGQAPTPSPSPLGPRPSFQQTAQYDPAMVEQYQMKQKALSDKYAAMFSQFPGMQDPNAPAQPGVRQPNQPRQAFQQAARFDPYVVAKYLEDQRKQQAARAQQQLAPYKTL